MPRNFLIIPIIFFLIAPPVDGGDLPDENLGHRLGVYVSPSSVSTLTPEKLEKLNRLGISVVELTGQIPENDLNLLIDAGLPLFIQQNRKFTTFQLLLDREDAFLQQDLELLDYYSSRSENLVRAFGLFIFPDDRVMNMNELMNYYAGRFLIESDQSLPLYYRSAFSSSDFGSNFTLRSVAVPENRHPEFTSFPVHFGPDDGTGSIQHLHDLFVKSLQQDESIIFIDIDWLTTTIEFFPPLEEAIRAYAIDQNLLFAFPDSASERPSPNYPVIFLVLITASFVFHYHFSPLYQKSLFRYFATHKFFVEDVMEYRIRSVAPGLIMQIQHLFVCGLFAYITAENLFSPLGLEGFFYHFPIFASLGGHSLSFFFWGVLFAVFMQTLSVLWIHLPNRQTRSLSQNLNLYGWPLQLNFVIVLFMVTIDQATDAPGGLYFFSVLFLFTWFMSFNTTAIDNARFLTKYRILYIIGTVGIYFLLIGAGILALVLTPEIFEPLRLAVNLP